MGKICLIQMTTSLIILIVSDNKKNDLILVHKNDGQTSFN